MKPTTVCSLLFALDLVIATTSFFYFQLQTAPMPFCYIVTGASVLFMVGLYYVREFAKIAEKKLEWK